MNTDKNSKEVVKEKPQIYFRNIRFNDDTKLILEKNSIIVFTGANNCGKSLVLKEIENCVYVSDYTQKKIIKEVECGYCGTIDEVDFFKEHFNNNGHINYKSSTLEDVFKNENLKEF